MDDFTSNLIWFIAGAIVGLITNLVSPSGRAHLKSNVDVVFLYKCR